MQFVPWAMCAFTVVYNQSIKAQRLSLKYFQYYTDKNITSVGAKRDNN